eukprot:1688441-Pyramimonas_sp.AAC.1
MSFCAHCARLKCMIRTRFKFVSARTFTRPHWRATEVEAAPEWPPKTKRKAELTTASKDSRLARLKDQITV